MSMGPLASFFNCKFHPGALCCIWLFKCLLISGNTNKHAGLLGRIRYEGETEAILLLVWRELCWNKNTTHTHTHTHLPSPHHQWPDWPEREAWDRMRRERGHQTVRKSRSVRLIFLPHPHFFIPLPLSLPHILNILICVNYIPKQPYVTKLQSYCYMDQINICLISA